MKYLILLLTCFLLAFPPAEPCAAVDLPEDQVVRTVDKIVARVGSEPITQIEVKSVMEDSLGLTFSAALEALIERRLVLSWARDHGLNVSPEEIETVEQSIMVNNNLSEDRFNELLASRGQDQRTFRDDLAEQILVNKALGTAIGPKVRIKDEDIRKKYEETYPSEETLVIRHILVKPEQASGESDAAAYDRAVRIIGEIRAGAPFETMAMRYSMDNASASKGGKLGTFQAGELLPELETLAFTLEPGEVGGPVKTALGFHILTLDSKGVSKPPPFSGVAQEIRASLTEEKEIEVRNQWLNELRSNTFIEIFPDGE